MRTRHVLLALSLCAIAGGVQAGPGCENLKGEIDAKIRAKGARGFTLEIVAAGEAGNRQVVGHCEGNSRRIVYTRDGGAAAIAPVASAPTNAATPPPAPAARPAPRPKAPAALGNY